MEPGLQCLVCLLLLQYLCFTVNRSKAISYRIEPDDPGGPFFVRDKSINDSFIFEFEKFETNTKYEVVVSYPGYSAIECKTNVSHQFAYDQHRVQHRYRHTYDPQQPHHSHAHGRRLLDTNVQMFKTGNRAKEQTIIKIIVKCQPLNELAFNEMIQSGAALKSHRKAGKVDVSKFVVEFGIKVESLWFGMIPNSLIGLAVAAVVLVFVVLFWITPVIVRNIKPKHE